MMKTINKILFHVKDISGEGAWCFEWCSIYIKFEGLNILMLVNNAIKSNVVAYKKDLSMFYDCHGMLEAQYECEAWLFY